MFQLSPITPAYGRRPRSKKEAQAHLDEGLDWRAASGQYTSVRDLRKLGLRQIEARSADLLKVWILKV